MRISARWREEAKKRAAHEAADQVRDGFVIGIGSGTTVEYAIREIGERVRNGQIKVLCIPTSYQVQMLASKCGITMTSLFEHPEPDLSIDGCDQIDERLNMIKGGGGALSLEKVVEASSKSVVVVADETKLTRRLGANRPVPIEVIPPAVPSVLKRISGMGGRGEVRMAVGKVGPVITDNGNILIDADLGVIRNPEKLEIELNNIPGVVENGLFVRLATLAYIGTRKMGVITLKSQKARKLTE